MDYWLVVLMCYLIVLWSPIREEETGGAAKHQYRIATGAFPRCHAMPQNI